MAAEPACRDSARHGFDGLVDATQGALLRYAYRLLRDREAAEDVVQEAYLRYLNKPPAFGNASQQAGWLFRVVHNLCMDLLKREGRRPAVHRKAAPAGEAAPSALALESDDVRATVDRLLSRLNAKQRAALTLFFQEEKSYKEIAEIMDESMSNVGMLLSRGLKKLRAIVEREGIET